jgi:hypothetical protein
MAIWVVVLVAVVVVTTVLLRFLREESITRVHVEGELHDPRTPILEYSVPTGQEPVTILAALERAGYTAGVDPHGAHQVVMVKCPDGPDRARASVRSLIESVSAGTPVRFRDES